MKYALCSHESHITCMSRILRPVEGVLNVTRHTYLKMYPFKDFIHLIEGQLLSYLNIYESFYDAI